MSIPSEIPNTFKKCSISGCNFGRAYKGVRKGEKHWATVCKKHLLERKARKQASPFAAFKDKFK